MYEPMAVAVDDDSVAALVSAPSIQYGVRSKLTWVDGADSDEGVGMFRAYIGDLVRAMWDQGMLKTTEDMSVPLGRDAVHDTGSGGIPFYKLDCVGDHPWFVSTAEIASALASAEVDPPRPAAGRYAGSETDDEIAWRGKWSAWIAFLHGALKHGGVRVG